jgi:hypothetical protein
MDETGEKTTSDVLEDLVQLLGAGLETMKLQYKLAEKRIELLERAYNLTTRAFEERIKKLEEARPWREDR